MKIGNKSNWDPKAWFEKGVSWFEYLEQSETNVERMKKFYEEFRFSEDTISFFERRAPLNLLCIVEDWCPDVVQNLAVVARLAVEIPGIEIRILKRDENPELMSRYLTRGNRRIPVIAFFDEDYNELGSWRGRSKKAQEWIDNGVLQGRTFAEVPAEELEAFNVEYDERFRAEFVKETIHEFKRILET